MRRGTVYLIDCDSVPWEIDCDGVLWRRAVFTFEVADAAEFQRVARLAYEDGARRLEFGPIGPPWRQG